MRSGATVSPHVGSCVPAAHLRAGALTSILPSVSTTIHPGMCSRTPMHLSAYPTATPSRAPLRAHLSWHQRRSSDHHTTIPARQCSPSFRFGDRLPFKSPRNDLPGAIEGNRKTAGRNETAVLEQRGLKTRKGPLPQTRRSEPVRNATTARLYNSGGSPGNHAARVFAAVWYVPSQVFSTSVGEVIRPL